MESHYDVKAINVDDGNSSSVGVCQVKLSTAKYLGFSGTEVQLQDPSINVMYAGLYLHRQLRRYRGDVRKAIASYNAGTYKESEIGECRNQRYVNKVMKAWSTNEVTSSKRLSEVRKRTR